MDTPKIIVVTSVRDEAWTLDRFLKTCSHFADHILVDDDSTGLDRSRVIYPKYPKVTMFDGAGLHFEARRKRVFVEARKIPACKRIIVALDSDELLSANLLTSPEWRKVLVVSVWSTSPFMNFIETLRRLPRQTRRLLRRLRGRPSAAPAEVDAIPPERPALFFHPRDHAWFAAHIATRHAVALRVWSAVTSEFQSRFFTDDFRGRLLASLVMKLEGSFPRWCGRVGQYPIWKFSKPSPSLRVG